MYPGNHGKPSCGPFQGHYREDKSRNQGIQRDYEFQDFRLYEEYTPRQERHRFENQDIRQNNFPTGQLRGSTYLPRGQVINNPNVPRGQFGGIPSLSRGQCGEIPSLRRGQFGEIRSLSRGQFQGIPSLSRGQYGEIPSLHRGQFGEIHSLSRGQFQGIPSLSRGQFRCNPGFPREQFKVDPILRRGQSLQKGSFQTQHSVPFSQNDNQNVSYLKGQNILETITPHGKSQNYDGPIIPIICPANFDRNQQELKFCENAAHTPHQLLRSERHCQPYLNQGPHRRTINQDQAFSNTVANQQPYKYERSRQNRGRCSLSYVKPADQNLNPNLNQHSSETNLLRSTVEVILYEDSPQSLSRSPKKLHQSTWQKGTQFSENQNVPKTCKNAKKGPFTANLKNNFVYKKAIKTNVIVCLNETMSNNNENFDDQNTTLADREKPLSKADECIELKTNAVEKIDKRSENQANKFDESKETKYVALDIIDGEDIEKSADEEVYFEGQNDLANDKAEIHGNQENADKQGPHYLDEILTLNKIFVDNSLDEKRNPHNQANKQTLENNEIKEGTVVDEQTSIDDISGGTLSQMEKAIKVHLQLESSTEGSNLLDDSSKDDSLTNTNTPNLANTSLTNEHFSSLTNQNTSSLTNEHTSSFTNENTSSLNSDKTSSLTNEHTSSLTNENTSSLNYEKTSSLTNKSTSSLTNENTTGSINENTISLSNENIASLVNENASNITKECTTSFTNENTTTVLKQKSTSLTNENCINFIKNDIEMSSEGMTCNVTSQMKSLKLSGTTTKQIKCIENEIAMEFEGKITDTETLNMQKNLCKEEQSDLEQLESMSIKDQIDNAIAKKFGLKPVEVSLTRYVPAEFNETPEKEKLAVDNSAEKSPNSSKDGKCVKEQCNKKRRNEDDNIKRSDAPMEYMTDVSDEKENSDDKMNDESIPVTDKIIYSCENNTTINKEINETSDAVEIDGLLDRKGLTDTTKLSHDSVTEHGKDSDGVAVGVVLADETSSDMLDKKDETDRDNAGGDNAGIMTTPKKEPASYKPKKERYSPTTFLDFTDDDDDYADDSDDDLLDAAPAFLESIKDIGCRPLPSTPENTNMNNSQGSDCQEPDADLQKISYKPNQNKFTLDNLLKDHTDTFDHEQEMSTIRTQLKADIEQGGFINILNKAEEVEEDLTLADDQKEMLNQLAVGETDILEDRPGEDIFNSQHYLSLFDGSLLPIHCGFTAKGTSAMIKHLSNVTPDQYGRLLSTSLVSMCFSRLPCQDAVVRWLFYLMSVEANQMIYRGCQARLQEILHKHHGKVKCFPGVFEFISVLVNYGASLETIIPNHLISVDQVRSKLHHSADYQAPSHFTNGDNVEVKDYKKNNLFLVLQILTLAMYRKCVTMSAEELTLLVAVLCKASLDKSLENCCGVDEFQKCTAMALKQYSDEDWPTHKVKIAQILPSLTSHHHNMASIAELLPNNAGRIGECRRLIGYQMLQMLLHDKKDTDTMLDDVQIKDLYQFVGPIKELLVDNPYKLSSVVTILDACVGINLHLNSKEREELKTLIELVNSIRVRDHVSLLDRTRVKDKLVRLTSVWLLDIQTMRGKQTKIFEYAVRDSPVKMKIETVKTSQADEDAYSDSESEEDRLPCKVPRLSPDKDEIT